MIYYLIVGLRSRQNKNTEIEILDSVGFFDREIGSKLRTTADLKDVYLSLFWTFEDQIVRNL